MKVTKIEIFFHISMLIWRQRNIISTIKDKDIWITGNQKITAYFVSKFEEQFIFSRPTFPPSLESLLESLITEIENLELLSIPKENEIKDVIWNLRLLKALS